MKIYQWKWTAILIIVVNIGFVSCGGDDDNDNKDKDPIVNPSNPNNGGNSDEGNSGNSGETWTAKGNGTLNNPYNVAGINAIASRLQAGEIDATDYYFKGMISQITNEFEASNNNPDSTATFYISDSGGTSRFLCNHVKYLHNEGYWGGYNINVGDEVIICGKITKDGTSTGKAYVYSMNDNTGTTDAIEYSIGGRTFRTVLVEGGPMKPFYIMQTEIPVNADIIINNRIVSMDSNNDYYINPTEFHSFLLNIRKISNCCFRLPTKEEWQYAAHGGNKSKGYTYSGSNSINDVAWYSGNSNKKVHDVAQKQPNELGLYDMSGNYGEVCYKYKDYYVDGPICGGNWNDAASGCTVSSWVEGEVEGKYLNGYLKALHFDGKYETVRLVYAKW